MRVGEQCRETVEVVHHLLKPLAHAVLAAVDAVFIAAGQHVEHGVLAVDGFGVIVQEGLQRHIRCAVVLRQIIAVGYLVVLLHQLAPQLVEAGVYLGDMYAGGIAVHIRLVLLYGLFRQPLVEEVFGRLVILARGGLIQCLLGTFAVGETLEKVLELVTGGVVVLLAHQTHAVVPRDVLGVRLVVIVHNQILEELDGLGVVLLFIIIHGRGILCFEIVTFQQLFNVAARG